MAKFFAYVALAACAVARAYADDVQPACTPVNLVDSTQVKGINNMIGMVRSFPALLSGQVPEPLAIANKALETVKFNPFDSVRFEITPTIQHLNVSGLQSMVPEDIKPTSANTMDVGVNFTKEVKLDATVSLSIKQVERKWYSICWTNLFKPKECPPLVIDFDVQLGIAAPQLHADMQFDMLQCTENPEKTCKKFDFATELLMPAAGLPATADKVALGVKHFVKRIKGLAVKELAFEFDSVTTVGLHFHQSGTLVTEVGHKLFAFSKDELNKKADVYNFFIENFNKNVATLVNKVIAEKLAPQFGATCRD